MKNALIFLGGAAVGGLAATLYFKRKMIILEEDYQRIANDEINKYICNKEKQDVVEYEKYSGSLELFDDGKNIIDINNCQKISEENGYIESEEGIDDFEDDNDDQVAPYIITPDEYGNDDDYTTKTLTAFTDKIVLDEDNCLFDAKYFGKDIMKALYSKKNIDSSIFVRDDNENIDYEIIKESISFDDYNKLVGPEDK